MWRIATTVHYTPTRVEKLVGTDMLEHAAVQLPAIRSGISQLTILSVFLERHAPFRRCQKTVSLLIILRDVRSSLHLFLAPKCGPMFQVALLTSEVP